MKQVIHQIRTIYANLRIKNKMFVLITFVMLTVSIASMSIQQYAFDVYDKEIYQQSAKSLHLSSFSIENELKKMERLSYRVATDPQIQAFLTKLNESESGYDRFIATDKMRERLLDLGGLDKYVLSLQLYDKANTEYAVGAKMVRSKEQRIVKIVKDSAEENGGIKWIFPDEHDEALIVAREVRSIANLELEQIGTVAIRIDMRKLFANFAKGLDSKESSFIIMSQDELVYPRELQVPLTELRSKLVGIQGYKILTLDNKRLFVTHVPSDYTDWVYMIMTPYDDIFQATTTVKHMVLIIFGILFAVVVILAIRFTRGITNPIESLSAKMKRVQLGSFEYGDDPEGYALPMDEAGQLHRNFRIMIERINELITENYKKQITIKETEFKALQAQINPHFLYNTLESINWSAKVNGQQQISLMVESLGFLLRSSMSLKEPLITLRQELDIVQNYINIQKIRFEERLSFHMDVPLVVTDMLVPKLSLQPIVENAINYGLEQMIGTCEIRIAASAKQELLEITMEDNGPGMSETFLQQLKEGKVKPRGSGIGLYNIDARIKLLFGEDYGMAIDSRQGVGTRVTLTLPAETGESHV